MMMPAIRYRQGDRDMFVTAASPQALLKFIQAPRLYDPRRPEETGNRPVDRGHMAGIVRYLEDETRYVLGAVTLYVKPGTVEFQALDTQSSAGDVALGNLLVPVDAKFEIGDGQHRLKAYEEVMRTHEADEHDPVLIRLRASGTPAIIVEESDASKTAQDFVDLQRNAKPLSSSLGAALDRRLAVNRLSLELAKSLELLAGEEPGERIEYLSQTVSKLSPKMYSFASWRFAVGTMIIGFGQRARRAWEKSSEDAIGDSFEHWKTELHSVFDVASRSLPGWRDVIGGQLTVPAFREQFVLGTAAGLTTLAGAMFAAREDGMDVHAFVQRASTVDWLKEPRSPGGSVFFEGTVVQDGRVLSYRPAFEAASQRLLDFVRQSDGEHPKS
jgi:DGQHR domain-containing protein